MIENNTYDQTELGNVCRKHSIKMLVLHGSYAKGQSTEKSDIDLGILGQGKELSKSYFEVIKDLAGIFGDKVDPAFLNGAEPMICYHVAMAGRPLFEAQQGIFANYRLQSIARYMDTKKFREMEKKYIKSAIAKG